MKKYIDILKKQSTYLEKGVNINDVVPATATHPGEILSKELSARKITQLKFAELCGVQPSLLNEVIKGKRRVNADMALILEKHLNIKAEFWLKVQMHYELDMAKIKAKNINKLKREVLKHKQVLKNAPKKSKNKLSKV